MEEIYAFNGSSVKGTIWVAVLILSVLASLWFVPFLLRRAARRGDAPLPSFNRRQRMIVDNIENLPSAVRKPAKKVLYGLGGFAMCFLCSMILVLCLSSPFVSDKTVIGPGLDARHDSCLTRSGDTCVVNDSGRQLVYCELKAVSDGQSIVLRASDPQYIMPGTEIKVDRLPQYICSDINDISAFTLSRLLGKTDKGRLFVVTTPAFYDSLPVSKTL